MNKDWAEHTAADGRKYYHNKVTKATTWEKPNELKTADEVHMFITLTYTLISYSQQIPPPPSHSSNTFP